jgi:hypothetical protein
MSRIKRLFRWAAQEELISGERYHAIDSVEGLRQEKVRHRTMILLLRLLISTSTPSNHIPADRFGAFYNAIA